MCNDNNKLKINIHYITKKKDKVILYIKWHDKQRYTKQKIFWKLYKKGANGLESY